MTRFTTTAQYIVHLTTVHRPFDTRIFQKECRTLAQAGYRVSLIVPHTTQETVEGVEILPLPRVSRRATRILLAPWRAFLATRARRAAREELNWEHESRKLLALYEHLLEVK